MGKRDDQPGGRFGTGFSLEQFYRLNRRILIWAILFLLLYFLRGFFGLIFLTFVLSFVATPMIRFAQQRLYLPRRGSVLVVYGLFLLALVSLVRFVVPQVATEAREVLAQLPDIQAKLFQVKKNLTAEYPSISPLVMAYIRSGLDEKTLEELEEGVESTTPSNGGRQTAGSAGKDGLDLAQTPAQQNQDDALIKLFFLKQAQKIQENAPRVLLVVWQASATMLLALLFSFLISMDITRLGLEIQSLRHSRLHDFYEQTAQPVVRFTFVLGRAIQAQAMIACVNTILTLIGLIVIGVPSLAVLSMIVFVLSFIPVLGVFISTTPIALVALNTGGLSSVMAVVLLVCIVHAIEAYLLNPMIYGRHLKLNPVLVLLILFIGHHLFGLWGMLLGVPVTHYFLHDVFGVPVWDERRLAPIPGKALAAMPRADSATPGESEEHEAGARASGEEHE